MAKRCIYFAINNQMYVKTFDVSWDKDSMEVNKLICSEECFNHAEKFMYPCVDLSSGSQGRALSIFEVKDDNGITVKEMWDKFDNNSNRDYLPPGCHELVYLSSLTEKQIGLILCYRSFYDLYHNPDKRSHSPAKACTVLQLLYKQRKIEYISDANKFLHWFWVNCRFPIEWCEYYKSKET